MSVILFIMLENVFSLFSCLYFALFFKRIGVVNNFVVISNETCKSKISQATNDMPFYFLFVKGEVHLNVIPS